MTAPSPSASELTSKVCLASSGRDRMNSATAVEPRVGLGRIWKVETANNMRIVKITRVVADLVAPVITLFTTKRAPATVNATTGGAAYSMCRGSSRGTTNEWNSQMLASSAAMVPQVVETGDLRQFRMTCA